jgi:hypothetical protein
MARGGGPRRAGARDISGSRHEAGLRAGFVVYEAPELEMGWQLPAAE